MGYRIPIEASCNSRSGARSKLETIWDFDQIPTKGGASHNIAEGFSFTVSRVEDREDGYPKRAYTSVDEDTFDAMRRYGWRPIE